MRQKGRSVYDKIMVPLDGSKLSEAALEPALELARLSGAKLALVQAYSVPGLIPGEGPEYRREFAVKQAEEHLDRVAPALKASGVEPEIVVAEGDPASVILDTAERLGVDLIVMSTHGRSGLGRWVLGSVAEKVVRHCHCKVMMIRPETTGASS